MFTVFINILLALVVGTSLTVSNVSPWYWSILWGLLILMIGQLSVGLILRKKMQGVSNHIQVIMKSGQAKMHAKMQRWQTKPIGSIKQAQLILAEDQRVMITQAREELRKLDSYKRWIPLLTRQLATMELQFAWQLKDLKRVDELIPKALFLEPMTICVRMARLIQKKVPVTEIEPIFRKAVKRTGYDKTVLIYALYSWYLVQNKQIDEAMKILVEGCSKNDHAVLKFNRDTLANNRVAHFSNAGLGDEWYTLFLEEPKIKAQRQQANGRFF